MTTSVSMMKNNNAQSRFTSATIAIPKLLIHRFLCVTVFGHNQNKTKTKWQHREAGASLKVKISNLGSKNRISPLAYE